MKKRSNFKIIGGTFAALAGLCFGAGIAVLTHDEGGNKHGYSRRSVIYT